MCCPSRVSPAPKLPKQKASTYALKSQINIRFTCLHIFCQLFSIELIERCQSHRGYARALESVANGYGLPATLNVDKVEEATVTTTKRVRWERTQREMKVTSCGTSFNVIPSGERWNQKAFVPEGQRRNFPCRRPWHRRGRVQRDMCDHSVSTFAVVVPSRAVGGVPT